jgi:lysophospholipase L1-like esterase
MIPKNYLVVILSAVASLLVLEAAVRIGYRYYGSEADRIRYVYSLPEIRRHQTRLSGAPYLGYGLTPGYPTQNARGFRGPDIGVPKPPGVFRIVALGGSTTYGDQIPKWEDAYPAQLQSILRGSHPSVEVINAGVPGYSSWEMLISFEFRLLDLEPDLLIVYEGINDVYPRLVRPSQYDGLATSKGVWKTDAPVIPASALYRFVAVRRGWIDDPTLLQTQFDRDFSAEYCRFNASFTRCENFDTTPDALLAANPPTFFERNMRNLVALARSNHVQVVLSSWAYYPAPIAGVANGTFMTLPFVKRGVAEHNEILRRVAETTRVPFDDLATLLPVDPAYWIEGIHMTPAGARAQAALYADFLTKHSLVH